MASEIKTHIGQGKRPGTVRVSVELPADLVGILHQIAALKGVPMKVTVAKALRMLREEIRAKGVKAVFRDDDGEEKAPVDY